MKGTILRVYPDGGYAFLMGEDGVSRFLHCKEVTPRVDFDLLRRGDRVEFTPVEDDGGKGNKQRCVEVTRC